MILPFSTQINGQPTYFVERIWYGLITKLLIEVSDLPEIMKNGGYVKWLSAKNHTIREDKKDRWKAGRKIDFFINCRQKDMFRFAPVLPVVSTQKVEITWKENVSSFKYLGLQFDRSCIIKIDGRFFGDVYLSDGKVVTSSYKLSELAMNDGFDTLDDFLAYFKDDFKGKIIHWTDLKY